MEIGCPNWHQASQCSSGDTRISGCIPRGFGHNPLRPEQGGKAGMQKLADEWKRKAHQTNKRKVGISFFQTAHFYLYLYPCIRMPKTFLKSSKIPADFRGQWVSKLS